MTFECPQEVANDYEKLLENDEEYYVRKAVIWINKNLEKGK